MGGDARWWDEDAYRDSILTHTENQTRTIFRTVFAPSRNSSPDTIVAASSDGSIAAYSLSNCISSNAKSFSSLKTSSFTEAEPAVILQGHEGPVYDVKFYGGDEEALLLSCGDDGRIRGWKWGEITEDLQHIQGDHPSPALEFINPQHRGPWGALSPMPENNAIAVDVQGGTIFAAAGDSCAYGWDVEKSCMKMVFRGHTDYLQCIIARNSSNQIITGSEDGTARLWDCRNGKCIGVISTKSNKMLKEFASVNCVALDTSESWLACGSGKSLSIWNLPAFECVSSITSRALIQDVVFMDSQIMTVGTGNLLKKFNIDGSILSQIQCAPVSAFSVSLHSSGVTAVAGYGGLVDVISQFGSHLCTFRCKSLQG
uniref:THO complex subunit 6 n=1 Tax=Kalanchoe fedtschenkoi TaxID=63787 RepID=A0A7N0TVV5_KALFE